MRSPVSTFAEQLWNVPAGLSEAALHGAVCGLLCAAPELSAAAYRRALIELLEGVTDMHDDEVDRFVELAAEDLSAPDLSFEPLLPDHDVELGERLTRLAEWAGAFVDGFEQAAGELDGDAIEAFDDILRISELDRDATYDDEAEFDYVSVCEHLKVAVLMVRDAVTGPDEEHVDDPE